MTGTLAVSPSVLDNRQLERIESVHRGFLYQHLYAAACLLVMSKAGATSVLVETDEDVEINFPDKHLYVQVKTRSEVLVYSDIDGAITRFDALRKEHAAGRRSGSASFVVASNVAPSPSLTKRMAEPGWPSDVELHWPQMTSPIAAPLPRPWIGVVDAMANISGIASALPFAMLAPDTLVWKLAGCILSAAAGVAPRSDHKFQAAELPALFEQLIVQLQDFPAPPLRYRPQIEEPPLVSDSHVRIVSGFSGAGKTSWVSQAALHTNDTVVYFNVGGVPSPALKMAIARELAVRLFGKPSGGLGQVLLPGATGAEILFAINRSLAQTDAKVTLAVDNAHRVSPADMRELTEGHTQLNFVLLCQPGPGVQELETRLSTTAEALHGWDTDTIAAEGLSLGCHGDFAAYSRLGKLTAGLPLYTQNALQIAASMYGGSVANFCAEIEAQTHASETAQEIILKSVFETFDVRSREAIGSLSFCDVPLERREVAAILTAALQMDPQESASLFRKLRAAGFMQFFGGDRVKIHDAIRPIARAYLNNDTALRSQAALKSVLMASLPRNWSLQKVSQLLRVFVALGDIKPLVEMATDELFHEMGIMPDIEAFLEQAVEAEGTSPDDRFWALDGLVFGNLKQGSEQKIGGQLDAMSRLIVDHNLGPTEKLAFGMKKMIFAAREQRVDDVRAAMEETARLLPNSPTHHRIARYNYAHALFELAMYDECAEEMKQLIPEYYAKLGITPADIFMKNPDKIQPLLPKGRDIRDDVKHLADCMDLLAKALNSMGKESGLLRINAMKFYSLANAVDSHFRVGQELVDEFIGRRDYIGARQTIETNLIPHIAKLKLASRVIPVRSQYAVVLAYCGDFAAADQEMARLAPYEEGMDERGKWEIQNQRRMIDRMRRVAPLPQW